LQEEVSSLKTSKTQLESTVTNLTDSLENYATKEYADSLPQNSGNYTSLSWTLIAQTDSTTYVKTTANINDYNYVAAVIYDTRYGFENSNIMSVSAFKQSCTSGSCALISINNQGAACSAYYNDGLYIIKTNTSSNWNARVYGIK
jgi:hypothetical protein